MNEMLIELGKRAKAAENSLRTISTDKKNQVLSAVADHLVECADGGTYMNEMLIELGKRAKAAENSLRTISTDKKNQVLSAVADHLVECADTLLAARSFLLLQIIWLNAQTRFLPLMQKT